VKEIWAKTVFAFLALAAATAAQSASGAVCGAKVPLAAAAFLWTVSEYGHLAAVPGAVFAGGFADALSCTPAFCTPSLFLLLAPPVLAARGASVRRGALFGAAATALAAGAAAVWLWLWTGCEIRFAAVVSGAAAGAALFPLFGSLARFFAAGAAPRKADGSGGEERE